MKIFIISAILAGVVASITAPANARVFHDRNGGLTLVWVTIRAYPGEGIWQACRRVYQRDAYQAAPWRGNKVRCKIDHSRIYRRGERRQNFNN